MSNRKLHIILAITLYLGCNPNEKKDLHDEHKEYGNIEMNDMPEMNHDSPTDSIYDNATAPTNKVVLSAAETIHPEKRPISDTILVSGLITFDARRNNIVSVRVAGRIEKLYVKINYQYVHKGDKVLELYSPELNTYIDEYSHHLKTKCDSTLIAGTRQKLLYIGLNENQITAIENGNKGVNTITVFSPYNGIVIFESEMQGEQSQNLSDVSKKNMSEMGGMQRNQSTSANVASGSRLREGEYVLKGQTLFMVNDCKLVNGIFSFSPDRSDILQQNTPIRIRSPLNPNEKIQGKIDFIEPLYKEGQKFTQARVYLNNSELKLKINSILSGEVIAASSGILVPTSSVLSLGNRTFVWAVTGTDKNGLKKLSAKQIIVGNTFKNYVQIISGISEHEQIAKDAGYLLDSESLIEKK